MATYDATPSAGSTQPNGSVMTTDDSAFKEYDEKVAAADLKRYRKHGPRPWTRTLIEAIKAEGVDGATLLDIGGGIGVTSPRHEARAIGAACSTASRTSTATSSTWLHRSSRRMSSRLSES